ncbi:MAG: Brp/Blh family beta-carotene 15,15'-dioxygenase [Candidatus Contendobacter sp.]|jgi:Brp/Blh family beta-carotene 15,15'-monooxygenase|nr:Brp/Blh family beta-carotene 15,15'-dioxygenase [Candidatus Contendobacter sp.]
MPTALPKNPARRPPVLTIVHLALTVTVGIGLNSLSIPWDAHRQWLAILALVAFFGLPHGALDPLLAYRYGLWRTPLAAVIGVLAYLALVGLMLVFWRWRTAGALAVFLGITAWHFSGDWRCQEAPLTGWTSVALLLGLPALAHPQVFVDLFALVLGDATARNFRMALAAIGAAALPLALLVAARVHRNAPAQALELFAIGIGGFLLPPLWFFTLYFCVLHSPRHIARHFAADARMASRRLWLIGFAFTLPVVGAAVWYVSGMPRSQVAEGFAQTLLAGLFALTVPHVLLLEWAERRGGLPDGRAGTPGPLAGA